MRAKGIQPLSVALLAIVILTAVACGSTVPASQQQAVEISEDEFGGDLSSGLPAGAHVNDRGQVVSAEGEVLGTAEEFGLSAPSSSGEAAGGTGVASTGSGGSGGGTAASVAAQAPGVTDAKIYFGIAYDESGPVNQAAFGVSLEVDQRQSYNAMIAYINKSGGLFGREVVPIYYKLDASSSQPIDQQWQAACAHWTEDNSVFGILTRGGAVFQECAEKVGAINTFPRSASLPETFRTYPHYFETSGLNLVRMGPVTVTGLDSQSYFEDAAKLGVVVWDGTEYKAALEQGYVPALESKGIELATEPAYISSPQTAQDLGSTSADINSAVLRFQTQGVTHVLILDGPSGLCGGACLGTLFMRRADSQEYRPRYGFNANNEVISSLKDGLYPPSQLRRSIAVEWFDNDKSYDEGWKVNQARERCYELMRGAGVAMDNSNRETAARFACEQFWFFQLIEEKLGDAPLTSDNFMVGVNRVGSGFSSPNAFGVHFSATQHDGIAAARNMKFVESCECYKWTSDPYRV